MQCGKKVNPKAPNKKIAGISFRLGNRSLYKNENKRSMNEAINKRSKVRCSGV